MSAAGGPLTLSIARTPPTAPVTIGTAAGVSADGSVQKMGVPRLITGRRKARAASRGCAQTRDTEEEPQETLVTQRREQRAGTMGEHGPLTLSTACAGRVDTRL